MERSQRRAAGQALRRMDDVNRSGKLVFETEGLGWTMIAPCSRAGSARWRRQDCVLVGPSGCGNPPHQTLCWPPEELRAGQGRHHLEVAYFRSVPRAARSRADSGDNVGGQAGSDGARPLPPHSGYLQDFLFEPKRARDPGQGLVWGEKTVHCH